MSKINLREGMFLGKEELQKLQKFQSELPKSLENMFSRNSDSSIVEPQASNFVFPLNPNHVKLVKTTTELGIAGVLLYHTYDEEYFIAGRYLNFNCPIGKSTEVTGINGFCPISSIISTVSENGRVYLNLHVAEGSNEDAAISITTQGQCSFVGWSRIVDSLRQGVTGRYTRIQLMTGEIYSIQSFDETTQTAQLVGESGSFKTVSKTLFKILPTLSPFSENTNDPLYTYERSSLKPTTTPTPYTVGYCEVLNGEITNVVLEPQSRALPLLPQSIKTGHLVDESVTTAKIADKSITMAKIADDVNLLGDGSVTTAKLANESVTEAKLDERNRWRIQNSILKWEWISKNQGQQAPFSGIRVCSITEGVYYDSNSINGTTIKDEDQYIWKPPVGVSLQFVNTGEESTEAGILFYCDWNGTKTFKKEHIFARDGVDGAEICWPASIPSSITLEGDTTYYLHYRRLQGTINPTSISLRTERVIIDTFEKMDTIN